VNFVINLAKVSRCVLPVTHTQSSALFPCCSRQVLSCCVSWLDSQTEHICSPVTSSRHAPLAGSVTSPLVLPPQTSDAERIGVDQVAKILPSGKASGSEQREWPLPTTCCGGCQMPEDGCVGYCLQQQHCMPTGTPDLWAGLVLQSRAEKMQPAVSSGYPRS
jgi:hypothetical protein